MRKMLNRLAMIGLLAVLSACNSTDALTPQVDVGGGVIPSSAVTERDIEAVSADTSPVGTAQQTALMGQTESRAEIATTTALSSPSGGEDTAGSLQAQADALSRNQQSAAATVERFTKFFGDVSGERTFFENGLDDDAMEHLEKIGVLKPVPASPKPHVKSAGSKRR